MRSAVWEAARVQVHTLLEYDVKRVVAERQVQHVSHLRTEATKIRALGFRIFSFSLEVVAKSKSRRRRAKFTGAITISGLRSQALGVKIIYCLALKPAAIRPRACAISLQCREERQA